MGIPPRPNRYSGGGGRSKRLTVTHLSHRDKRKQTKIRHLDRLLNKFRMKEDGFLKFRELFTMYGDLEIMDTIARDYYPKFEACVPENVRPSKIISHRNGDGTITVDGKLGIVTLRSLIAGLGPYSAPLVRFAKVNHIDESDRYYILENDVIENKRTCAVYRVEGKDNRGSLGHIPWKSMAMVIALERDDVELAGDGDVEFERPDKINMIEWASYKWPKLMTPSKKEIIDLAYEQICKENCSRVS